MTRIAIGVEVEGVLAEIWIPMRLLSHLLLARQLPGKKICQECSLFTRTVLRHTLDLLCRLIPQ